MVSSYSVAFTAVERFKLFVSSMTQLSNSVYKYYRTASHVHQQEIVLNIKWLLQT